MLRSTLLLLPLLAGPLVTAAPTDAATSLTCQGAGIDPAARLHHRAGKLIEAPARTAWKLHTDVAGWPAWQTAVTGARRLDPGPLRPGSRFRWATPAPATPTTSATTLVITSTVEQLRPGRCVRWTGPAIGDGLRIDRGVHVWTFTPVRGGVLVRTEESWTGGQVEADPATAIRYLAAGLDTWLAELETTAETR
ncbi:SRPBCC family protein [Amycolatopsis sp. CA-128772]|uniref:SRPBCC family protein n=1 Tax=Amycolatopsis sp. CA-128772 TaxID=2073159 RepID=UPI000CD219F8|nr:SRPBCC family protein [Amycolatopsis sp. CA-128772]